MEEGVTSISAYAFYSAGTSTMYSALESVTIAGSVKTIGSRAFMCANSTVGNSSVLTTINLGEGIEEIGTYAFSQCRALTTVTIPDSVNTIGNYAFQYCTALTTLVVGSGITSMGTNAFRYCSALENLTLKNGITTIGSYSFANCTSLTDVEIPDSVVTISDGAFHSCTGLEKVTIGNGVTSIGASAFNSCTSLKTVIFTENSSLKSFGSQVFGKTAIETIVLPDTLTDIGGAFHGCTTLKSITLPENITEIPSEAFRGCTSLESLIAKGTITKIGNSAFSEDSNLSVIPDLSNITEMGTYAFNLCSSLTGTIDLSSLDTIPAYAFYGCKYITGVTFSDSLTSIGDYAFCSCCRIESLDFPDTLTTIGNKAFWNNWLLGNNITTTVASGAAVTDVSNSETTTLTEETSYSGYTLVIPDSVTSIGNSAFEASYVYVFDIGSGLTEVDATAFATYRVNAVIFDNMEDDVTVTSIDSLDDKKDDSSTSTLDLVYLQGSIGDVGDTISNEEGAMTLQQAVDAVAAGTYTENGETTTTITISKNIKLSSTLNVPADFNGTITTADGESYIIKADSSANLDNLIEVEEGAQLAVSGNVTLNGKSNSGSIIYTEGTVTLDDSATITGSSISDDSGIGVIDVVGSNAKFIMNGGIVEKNYIGGQYSGVIRASEGGKIIINDGVIQNNKSSDLAWSTGALISSGIMLYGESYGEMNGGTIQNNTSFRGAAIYMYSIESGAHATFVLNGGTITGNTSPATANAAGAVYVHGNSSFTMEGGTISDNYGYSGGGVSVADYFYNDGCDASFVMNGGTISGNKANAGGGIYSYSNGVVLNAGYITDNTATVGGGVYSEGNSEQFTTVQMYNVLISENSADQGGGMWFCPTGIGNIYVTNGGAVVQNIAKNAGNDIVFASGDNTSLMLADRILGGGKVYYYDDGIIYMVYGSDYYTSASGENRYTSDSDRVETNAAITSNTAAIASVEDSAVELAENMATLYITGNTATYGGGVGSNGGVTIGDKDITELTVNKTWEHKNNPESNYPESIKLQLINTYNDIDYVIETVTVKADDDGKWNYTFENLPVDGNYSIKEITPDYYEADITDATETDDGYEVNITNTYQESSLNVSKSVTGNYGNKTTEFNFTVTLSDNTLSGTYGEMTFENGVATFKLKDGENITAIGLPAGISYEVVESEANKDGYTTTSVNENGTLVEDTTSYVTFTNDRDVYITINGSKTWDDANDQDGIRPQSIIIRLYANDEEIQSVEITESDNWSWSFTDLPKYEDGEEITYTISEDAVDGYTTSIDGYNVTNTHTPETIPGTSSEPTNPTTQTETSTTNTVKTSDMTQIGLWIALLFIAGCGIIAYRKRKMY